MVTRPRGKRLPPPDEVVFAAKKRKVVPHAFVLDELERLGPETKPMFGCLAVYVEDKIVLILRDKPAPAADNGVWVATTQEHHESLRAELPSLRSIGVLGSGVTGWQLIPAESEDFEEAALRACELVLARDPRIGKVPKPRRAGPGARAAKVAKAPAKVVKAKKAPAAKKAPKAKKLTATRR